MSAGDPEMAHVRSLPSDYIDVQDQSYDPNYISDISKQMQVPDHICVNDGNGASQNIKGYADFMTGSRQFSSEMNVPDRIIVAGDNQHIGLREGMRRLPMDRSPYSQTPDMVELTTPPRVLTVERLPMEDEAGDKPSHDNKDRHPPVNGHLAAPVPYTPGLSPNDSLLLNEEDEATLLRTQVAKLMRRVAVIEEDGQRRATREMGLYIALFGYIVWKAVFSFFRSR